MTNLITDDCIIPFQVGETGVRGRVVRMGGAVSKILRTHDYPAPVSELVSDAICLTALMGSALKFDGKLIFQAQGDGPISLVVADYKTGGNLRAMAKTTGEIGDKKGVELIGDGQFVLTIDQGEHMERYQGVTPLIGDRLAASAKAYFAQSEQIPTRFRTALGRVTTHGAAETWRTGGAMLQKMPDAPVDDIDHDGIWSQSTAFFETISDDELLDPNISAETLLYRLFHEVGVRVFDPIPVQAACSCTADAIGAVLARYSREDLAEMVDDGDIEVTCEFCRAIYVFDENGILKERA